MLLQSAATWKKIHQEGKADKPLRAHLVQTLFTEFVARLDNVKKASQLAAPANTLWTALIDKELVTKDGRWHYLKWDHSQQKMVPNSDKAPLNMQQLTSLLEGISEAVQDGATIQKLQSMGESETKTLPWKLQVSIRCDDLIAGLTKLSHSSATTLMGMTMKCHQAQLSKPAQQLQVMMGKGKGKSKKGKGKNPQAV